MNIILTSVEDGLAGDWEHFVVGFDSPTIVKVQFMGAVGMKKLDLGFAKLEKA